MSRSFNTTGSKSTLDQWEKRLASKHDFQDILIQLQFFGALCLDEYVPKEGGRYEQMARDAIKTRFLYIEPVPWPYGRGVTERSLREDPQSPRSGHSETLINVWCQMETIRRGFKTSEEDAKPPKVALTTSNHLCENLDLRAIRDRPEFFS